MDMVELRNGEVIENVTKVTEGEGDFVNVHTPGSGYRIVKAEDIDRVEAADPVK